MIGVVKKFTIKKGVSLNMARKTKNDALNASKREALIEVMIEDPRYPHMVEDYAHRCGLVSKTKTMEFRRATATRIDYSNKAFLSTYCDIDIDREAEAGTCNQVVVRIIKGISYYYVTVYFCLNPSLEGEDV
jgi:hypothetical protein